MLPTLADVLAQPALDGGEPVVRAGADRLNRPVRWVHVSEVSWIAGLLDGGELILTTGIALPRAPRELHRWVWELAEAGVCGVVVELGRRFRRLPASLVDAAVEADLPLVELRREVRFVAVTQQVHTLILDARMRELVAADEREAHRALLTLLTVASELPDDVAERAAALGVPLVGRTSTAVVVRPRAGRARPGLLRELAAHAADEMHRVSVPSLVAVLDEHRVAMVLSQDGRDDAVAVVTLLARHLHTAAADAGAGHPEGDADGIVVGASAPVDDLARVRSALAEAAQVADTAADLPVHQGWFRVSDLRLQGLLHALRTSQPLQDFVERDLAPLLAHDRQHSSSLVGFLEAYCRAGGNKTAAAAQLYISRAALYDRVARVERVLGVDLADAQTVLSLHLALLAREAIVSPGAAVRAV